MAYSNFEPFSSEDISDDEWNANVARWRAAQGRWDSVAPPLDALDAGGQFDPTNSDLAAAIGQAEMSHTDWQLARAQQIAARDGDSTISGEGGDDQLDGGAAGDEVVTPTPASTVPPSQPIDPQRIQVFQPGPDGKLHPIPGWHTTGPFDFGEWSHNIDWSGVAEDLANIGVDAAMSMEGVGVLRAVQRGTATNVGRMTAEAARKQLRRRGAAGVGEEIHHSVSLNGIGRTVENWRNHPAFLKVLPKADHRRLTGSWQGLPQYGPIQRFIVGTPNWMKTVPAWLGVHGFDWFAGPHGQSPANSNLGDPTVPPTLR
jgi:hypothetical protein